ncbi:MAG: c-type cytochrome, partial [Acidobacteriota bacterium]
MKVTRAAGPGIIILGCFLLLGTLSACAADADRGRDVAALYTGTCAGCHGPDGRADGPAAPFLYPRPRDFTRSPFKFGGQPHQIVRTITNGLPGTSMPPFGDLLSTEEIASLADYVGKMSPHAVAEATVEQVSVQEGDAARGQEMFSKACASCHGPKGRGDGVALEKMVDDLHIPIQPIDLGAAPYKGGDAPEQIYARILRGIPGTPMPSFGEALTQQQMWDLVAFVRSLRPPRDTIPEATKITVHPTGQLPAEADAAAWSKIPAAAMPLRPLWQRRVWPPNVTVRAAYDGKTVRFLLEWPDAVEDRTVGKMDDFLDAVALMLPEQPGMAPFIGMGTEPTGQGGAATVRIWQWRATTGTGPQLVYPRIVRDENPLAAKPWARPASLAGNPLAGRAEGDSAAPAVLEYVASGPGTLTVVPAARRVGGGSGAWKNGTWRVALDLAQQGRGAVLAPGTKTL